MEINKKGFMRDDIIKYIENKANAISRKYRLKQEDVFSILKETNQYLKTNSSAAEIQAEHWRAQANAYLSPEQQEVDIPAQYWENAITFFPSFERAIEFLNPTKALKLFKNGNRKNIDIFLVQVFENLNKVDSKKLADSLQSLIPDVSKFESYYQLAILPNIKEINNALNEIIEKPYREQLRKEEEKQRKEQLEKKGQEFKDVESYFMEKGESLFNSRRGNKPMQSFPTPPVTIWDKVNIQFISRDCIKISVGKLFKKYTFAEIGFKDNRKGDFPDEQWNLLYYLACHDGKVSYKLGNAITGIQKNVQTLRKRLKALTGIHSDPFKSYQKAKGYETIFHITAMEQVKKSWGIPSFEKKKTNGKQTLKTENYKEALPANSQDGIDYHNND